MGYMRDARGVRLDSFAVAGRQGLRPVAPNVHVMTRNSGANALSDGVSTGITTRLQHVVATASGGIRLAFANAYNNAGTDADGPNPITVKCSLRLTDGTFVPVYFRGSLTATVDPGGVALSDPVGVQFSRGDTFYSHTYVSVTSGLKYPLGLTTNTANSEGVASGDLTGTAVTASATKGYGPWAVLGAPAKALASPVILTVGDSRVAGYGDFAGTSDAFGWVRRALDQKLSYLNVGVSGSTALVASLVGNLRRRFALADHCLYDAAVVSYGINDLSAGKTSAQVIGYLTTVYGLMAARGMAVYGATIPPVTTSTDSWATTANQTVAAWNAQRVAVNDWIRTKPAPLAGYFEFADAVETARGSGLWKVTGAASGYTLDGTHESGTGYAAEAATIDLTKFGPVLTA